MNTPYLDPYQVRLIGSDNRLAEAAVEINHKYPGPLPNRYRGRSFGGVGIEEVYVYPPQALVPAG